MPKPAGVFTCNDDRSQEVVEACNVAGVRVPEEVAILGVDDDSLVCALSRPSLSSISLNFDAAGWRAAELLDRMMAGQRVTAEKILVEPIRVVTRVSTDALAVESPEVAAAIHFIRQNAHRLITVADVAEACAMSRRSLERRFSASLGKTIQGYIKHSRVTLIQQMLHETSMSIPEIARRLGYSNADHIARLFRRFTGQTLRDFRQRPSVR